MVGTKAETEVLPSFLPLTELSGALQAKCGVSAGRSKALEMQIFNSSANGLVIANTGDVVVELKEWSTLALFGTGRFKYINSDKADMAAEEMNPATDIPFELHDQDSKVIFNNNVQTVGDIMEECRAKTRTRPLSRTTT